VTAVLVDSNVLLDLTTDDLKWAEWSAVTLTGLANEADLVINPVIYAEVCGRFGTEAEVAGLLSPEFEREPLPYEAAYLAGRLHARYRQLGGARDRTLPDFLIGAHAVVMEYRLLTRDARRYRTYFPKLEIIAPNEPAE
jgi:predicted nucleic acid-binding protein